MSFGVARSPLALSGEPSFAGAGGAARTRQVGELRVGVLNCWENWMPLARTALQSDGMDVHILLWPGAKSLTRDLTRVVAREGRCFAVSVGGVLAPADLPKDLPELDDLRHSDEPYLLEGGSGVAGPDGAWGFQNRAVFEFVDAVLGYPCRSAAVAAGYKPRE